MQTLQESRWVGRVLRDKWRIDRKIARGGMGTVFAATHKNNGSRAAIKVLHAEYARDPDTRSRFIQEGYAANQVGHPGVVRILDDDTTDDGLPFIVMELLEGELLEQRRIHAGGKLPIDEVYEIADQLLAVISAAHAKGIIHRDIKPDNIFVTNEGMLKVLDFGFARMRDGLRTEQTATGFLLGTPGFMSPEQAAGTRGKIDARTDVWAIGATMFVLLTGQPVHEGETAAEMLVQAANFAVRPIGELDPRLPIKLRQLVDKSLAFDRNDRYADAGAMLGAVRLLPGRNVPADEDQRTVMRPSPASQSAHEDATVMGRVEELPSGVLESIYTPMTGVNAIREADTDRVEIHPADAEQQTLAIDTSGPTMAAQHLGIAPPSKQSTAKVQRFALDENAPEERDHTVMMQSRPQNFAGIPSPLGLPAAPPAPPPSYPDLNRHAGPPPPSHASIPMPMPPPQAQPQPVTVGTRPAMKRQTGVSSVLVFFAVAGITMVVVILTGLVVIVGTE